MDISILQPNDSGVIEVDESAQHSISLLFSVWKRCPNPDTGPFQNLTCSRNHPTKTDARQRALRNLRWDWGWARENYTNGMKDGRAIRLASEAGDPLFPQFARLPVELQEEIWRAALPRRVIDARCIFKDPREGWHRPMPLPTLARVCRLSRHAVLRSGRQLRGRHRFGGVGYNFGFILDCDTFPLSVILSPPGSGIQNLKRTPNNGHMKIYKSIAAPLLFDATYLSSVVLSFRKPHRNLSAKFAVLRKLPALEIAKLDCWPSLYLDVLLDGAGEVTASRLGFDRKSPLASRDMGDAISRTVLVDLFDDVQLAQVCLFNLGRDGEDNSGQDAPQTPYQHSMRCINCFRRQWQRTLKASAEQAWQELMKQEETDLEWEAELDDEAWAADFPARLAPTSERAQTRGDRPRQPEFRPVLWLVVKCLQDED